MYLVPTFVLLQLAVGFACRPPPCHWHDAKPIENYFNQVVNKVIAADRKLQNFCNKQGCANIQEIHSRTEYKIVIPSAGSGSYEIKVRDRVVQIVSDGCQNSITELRILPTYVDGYGGHYSIEGNDLVVSFPYMFDPSVGGGSCEEVNRSTVTLYQGCNDCNHSFK